MAHCEVRNKHGWTITPTAIHVLLDLPFYLVDQTNAVADCLENQFTPHDMCDENHERRAEDGVQTLLAAEDNDSPEKIRPCHLQKLINTLTLKRACVIHGIPNEYVKHLPRRSLVHLTHLINHCIQLSHFPISWKEAKVVALPKPGKDHKFP
jgi:hypothetical protein